MGPARRKNSKQLSSPDSVQNVTSEQKEKKTSFIKEWQKDLKEFFSLGKKKKRDKSLSRGSSSKRSDNDSRQVDFSKYEKSGDNDEAIKEENLTKGNNERFSTNAEDSKSGRTNAEDTLSKQNEDIYGYTKDLNSTDVDADMQAPDEQEPVSNKGDPK